MIDLEKNLAPLIAERCKKLREDYKFTMEKVSDKFVSLETRSP